MLVIAHRGFSGRFPENTALAFERAITSGAHLIETDLRLWVTAERRPDREAAGYITAGRLERLIALGAAAALVNDVELAVRVTRARQCIT